MKINEQRVLEGFSQLATVEDLICSLESVLGEIDDVDHLSNYVYEEISKIGTRVRSALLVLADTLSEAGLNVSTAYLAELKKM